MMKLLHADFTRIRKSKLFWILSLFSIGLALLMIGKQYPDMKLYGQVIEVEQIMLNYSTMIGIVIAIFTSLFLGVEYSDGIIRNKIIIGYKRMNVYFSNLIITALTSLCSYLLFIIIVVLVGIPLFGGITISYSKLLMLLWCIFITIIAYSSIFTFVAMMISNKTITAVTSIMLAFSFMMIALTCLNVLQTPPFIEVASIKNDSGDFEILQEPNPKYPSEKKRKLYQTALDINPAGQMFQIAGRTTPNLTILPLYSCGILITFTSVGLFLFQKKEFK